MRFAICNELFSGWSLPTVLHYVAELGYEGLELAPYSLGAPVGELSAAWRREARQEAKRAGVQFVGLHWLLAETQGLHLTHPETEVRQRTASYLVDLAQLTADLGGHVMVFGSPQQRSLLPGVTHEQAEEYAEDTLIRCLPRLQSLAVALCLEPLGRDDTDFINTASDAIRIIRTLDHPSLRLHLDMKAMIDEGRPLPEIIREGASYIAHFHANDGRGGPGFGALDFAPILGTLLEVGYDGYVSVEVFDFSLGPRAIAGGSIANLRAALARARGVVA